MQSPTNIALLRKQETALHFGPLAFNAATAELKNITKALLNGSKVTCTYGPFGLEMEIAGKKHNISLLIENADFTQLVLDEADIAMYPVILDKAKKTKTGQFATSFWINKEKVKKIQEEHSRLKDLKYGEVQAINIYTGDYYPQVNGLLRGSGLPPPLGKFELPKTQKELDDYATQLFLVSMLSVSGLNRIEATDSLSVDSVSMRGDNECLPPAVVEARLKAVEEYKKKNYVSSVVEMKGFVSTTEVSYTCHMVANRNDVISKKFDIGFYVTRGYILVKASGSYDVKISSPDPLWAMIKSIHDEGRDFTASEKSLVLNDPRLAELTWAGAQVEAKGVEAGFDGKYKTKFTNLVGKNVAEISNCKSENEILMPPVHIQWVDAQVVGEKVFFTGHPIDVLESQKDATTVIRGYNAFKSLNADMNGLNKTQKNLLKRLKAVYSGKAKSTSNVWNLSTSKLITNYIERLDKVELVVQHKIRSIDDLRANISEVLEKANDLEEANRMLKSDKRMLLHQFDAILDVLLSNEKLTNIEAKTGLLSIKTEAGNLLQKSETTTDDLIALSEKIRQKIPLTDKADKATSEALHVALYKLYEPAHMLRDIKATIKANAIRVKRHEPITLREAESLVLKIMDYQKSAAYKGGRIFGPLHRRSVDKMLVAAKKEVMQAITNIEAQAYVSRNPNIKSMTP